MQRITVPLPDELDARLQREASRRGVTASALAREAIRSYLDSSSCDAVRGWRQLFGAGAGASGQADISARVEQILRTELPSSR